jgi:hypothetical protein
MSLNTRLRLALSTSQSTSDAEKKVSHLSLLKTPRVAISILNYSLFALIDISFAALQPLFFATPIHLGGLGLPPSKIGPILAVDGVMNGLVLLLFNRLTKRWGVKRVYVWSVAAFVILFGTFPAMNLLVVEGEPMGWKVWAVLGIQLALTGMPSIGYGLSLLRSTLRVHLLIRVLYQRMSSDIHQRLIPITSPLRSYKRSRPNLRLIYEGSRTNRSHISIRILNREEFGEWEISFLGADCL